MRVLMLHAPYKIAGGEDELTRAEADALRAAGYEVEVVLRPAAEASAATLAAEALGLSDGPVEALLRAADSFQPDVVHLQNASPRWGPAALNKLRGLGVPVVAAARNYRMFCPTGTMWRDGSPCMDCAGMRLATPAVMHGCYRWSRAQSAVAAASLALMRWGDGLQRIVAVSAFVKAALLTAGVASEDRIVVKPNCVAGGPVGLGRGGYALYCGGTRPGKGADLLADAWSLAQPSGLTLRVAAGFPHAEVLDMMGNAAFVVVPSTWPEPFGRVVIEAYSRGTPVVASDAGGLPELVEDGVTGWLHRAGDVRSLTASLAWAAREAKALRGAAHAAWRTDYTPEANAAQLADIYWQALGGHSFNENAA